MASDMDALAQTPRKRAGKRAKRTCVILLLATLLAVGLYVNYLMDTGNDWLIHRIATLTPSRLKAERLASQLNSADPAVSAKAEKAILALRDKSVIKALVRYAGETDPGLNGLGGRICSVVARIGEPAFEPLLEAARESPAYTPRESLRLWCGDLCERIDKRNFGAIQAAYAALHAIGKPAIAPAARLLQSGDEWQKQQAVGILGQISDPEAPRALIAYVPLTSGRERAYAVQALTWQHSPLALDTFADIVKQQDSFGAWEWAAIGLGDLRDPRAAPYLMKMVSDADPQMRSEAIYGLRNFPSPEVNAAFANALCDRNWGVRQAAAESLGECGDESAWQGLCTAASDSDKDVCTAAKNALKEIQARTRKTLPPCPPQNGNPSAPAPTASAP